MKKLKLLTDNQIKQEYKKDCIKQEKWNSINEKIYPTDGVQFIMKWKIYNPKYNKYWTGKIGKELQNIIEDIKSLNTNDFLFLIHLCSSKKEPSGKNEGIGTTKPIRIARIIRYELSSKQREVLYRKITNKWNFLNNPATEKQIKFINIIKDTLHLNYNINKISALDASIFIDNYISQYREQIKF